MRRGCNWSILLLGYSRYSGHSNSRANFPKAGSWPLRPGTLGSESAIPAIWETGRFPETGNSGKLPEAKGHAVP